MSVKSYIWDKILGEEVKRGVKCMIENFGELQFWLYGRHLGEIFKTQLTQAAIAIREQTGMYSVSPKPSERKGSMR